MSLSLVIGGLLGGESVVEDMRPYGWYAVDEDAGVLNREGGSRVASRDKVSG